MAFLNTPEKSFRETLNEIGLDALSRGRILGAPRTYTRMNHALTIRTGTGRTIGAINGWNPVETRTHEDIFENEVNSNGLPVDIIPQILSTRTIRVSRYDLYARIMEEAFGTRELVVLTVQAQPFKVREIWREPSGRVRAIEYVCWMTDIGKNHRTDGNRIVQADATLVWLSKRKVL